MPSHIPRSRLGRALKAGIPIALILLGVELIEGRLTVERNERRLVLSWSSPDEQKQQQEQRAQAKEPLASLTACLGGACGDWRVSTASSISLLASDTAAVAQAVVGLLSSDRSGQGRASGGRYAPTA